MLREYIWRACTGREAARLTGPRIVTPCFTTSLPASVSSQLPPISAARSTITEPGRISRTVVSGIRIGAFFPGTIAVLTTTSDCLSRSATRWRCFACCSGVSSFA